MESYLEAIDTSLHTTAINGFPAIVDKNKPTLTELSYERWNAKARNILFRGLCKDVFNCVRNIKDAHKLWEEICALHEGTKSEHEQRYSLLSKKINSFTMLANENANQMYSRLNILVEELKWPWFDTNGSRRCGKKDFGASSSQQVWQHCHHSTSN